MDQDKYSLTWKTYTEHLKKMLSGMLNSDEYSDVTLVCEDKKQLRAHKNILAACSPLFHSLLQLDKGCSSIVYLRGVFHSEMESLLNFIYLGEATFNEERLNDFLSVAKSLEIKGLISEEEMNTQDNAKNGDEVIPIDEIDNLLSEDIKVQAPEVISDKHDTKDAVQKEQLSNKEIPGPQIESPNEQPEIADTLNQLLNENEATDGTQTFSKDSKQEGEAKTQSLNDTMPLEKPEKVDQKLKDKIVCKECSKEFEDTGSLYLHQQAVHAPRVFICEFCPYEATTKRSFEIHVQRQHARFHCSRCTYRATSKLNLVTHVKLNHDHQKYNCDQCEYQTTKQINLTNHVKAKHEGIKFSCEYCGKPFSQKYNLASHIKMKHSLWLS